MSASAALRRSQLQSHVTPLPALRRHCHSRTNGLLNPLESRGNYSATSNNMRLVYWPLMCGLLHLVQRGGDWAGLQPAQAHLRPAQAHPRCTKCNSPPTNGQCINQSPYTLYTLLSVYVSVALRFLPRDAIYKRGICRHAVSVCICVSVCPSRS